MADPAEFNRKVKVLFMSYGTEAPLENPEGLKRHQEQLIAPGSRTATSICLPAPRTNGRRGEGASILSLSFYSSRRASTGDAGAEPGVQSVSPWSSTSMIAPAALRGVVYGTVRARLTTPCQSWPGTGVAPVPGACDSPSVGC